MMIWSVSSVCTMKIQVASFTISHEKALHNYFNPCQKSWANLRKFSEELRNLRENPNLRKRFKTVFEEALRFLKIFGKSLEMF